MSLPFGRDRVPVVLLTISLALNVYLGFRLSRVRYVGPREVAAGSRIPHIAVRDLDGRRFELDWASVPKPTVLYFFSPKCGWCALNLRNIVDLAGTRKDGFRFVGLSAPVAGLREYVLANHLDFSVYSVTEQGALRDIGLASTPQTLVISRLGVVIKSWQGAYAARTKQDVEEYFGVHLPGLVKATASSLH
jgi:peroxiredoxin